MKNLVIIDNRETNSGEVTNEFGLIYGASLAVNGQLIIEKQLQILIDLFTELKIILVSSHTDSHTLIQKKIIDKFKIEVQRSKLKFGDYRNIKLEIDKSFETLFLLNSQNLITKFPEKSSYIYTKTYENAIKRKNLRVNKNINYKLNGSFFLKIKINDKKTKNFHSYITKIQQNPFVLESFFYSENIALDTISMFFELQQKNVNSRFFNQIKVLKKTIIKSSKKKQKLKDESKWYTNAPESLSLYIPKLVKPEEMINSTSKYEIERIAGFPLSDHFVFNNLDDQSWENIFVDTEIFLKKCKEINLGKIVLKKDINRILFFDKLIHRLKAFTDTTNIEWDKDFKINGIYTKSLKKIVDDIENILSHLPKTQTFMHGDFCFNNIIYESRLKRVFVIDPRGSYNSDCSTNVGTFFYDRCKFYHSIYGLYDFIVQGMFSLKTLSSYEFEMEVFQSPNVTRVQEIYKSIDNEIKLNSELILKLLPTLFMSMLPLHFENKNRQMALFTNALLIHERSFS